MNIIAVDDEPLALDNLISAIKKAVPQGVVRGFSRPGEALAAIQDSPADVAFMDIKMVGMNGVELALRFKETCPFVNIIFVTAHDEYALAALKARASGYLLKPVTAGAIREELDNLRIPLKPAQRIVVRTFGDFEVFAGDLPLHFGRSKAKELFGLLIDRRGAGVTTSEACLALWPGRSVDFSLQRQFQTVVSEMLRSFRNVEAEYVILRRRNFLAVDTTRVDCDLYRMVEGEAAAINSFQGRYMLGYTWAKPVLPGRS